MSETRVFADGYRGVFQNQEDFLKCLNSIGRNSFWERKTSKNLRLVAITSGSKVEEELKQMYADEGLKVAKGEALLRISEGKVSAVLGGDCHDYAVFDMEQVFLHSVDYLTKNFRGCSYLAGFYEHDMASALWEFSGEDWWGCRG